MSNTGPLVDPHSAAQVNASQVTGVPNFAGSQNMLELMIGPPTSPNSQRSTHSVSHNNVYDLYEGDNLFLGDTVKGFVMLNQSYETSVFPWVQTNQMTIQWNEFQFDRTMANAVPNSGIQRLLTHSKSKKSARIMRYGKAFRLDMDTINTAEGIVLFRRSVAGLVQACQMMVNFHTNAELVQCKTVEREMNARLAEPGVTLDNIAQINASNFAVDSRSRREGYALIEKERQLLRTYHQTDIDVIIAPPGYTFEHSASSMAQERTYTEFYQIAPSGTLVPTRGPVSEGNYAGFPVYIAGQFSAYSDGPMVDPLLAPRTVAEYYCTVDELISGQSTMPAWFTNRIFDLYIYSGESDKDEKVSYVDMFRHSNLFGGIEDDKYGPCEALVELVRKHNDELRKVPGALDEEMALYSHREEMEASASSGSARRQHMLITHDTDNNQLSLAKIWGDLDIDVMPLGVSRLAASSLINKIAPPHRREKFMASAEEAHLFIRELEEAEYNDAFARALSNENIDASVDKDSKFVGSIARTDLTRMITWESNAYSALDLPTRDEANPKWPAIGCGLASYPMIEALARQGKERGYGDVVVGKAANVVALVRALKSGVEKVAGSSGAIATSHVPEWFNYPTAEIAVFTHMHIARPPIALGVASDQAAVGERAATKGFDLPKKKDTAPQLWSATTTRDDAGILSLAAVPRFAIVLSMLGLVRKADEKEQDAELKKIVAATAGGNPAAGVAADLNKAVKALFTGTADEKNAAEDAMIAFTKAVIDSFLAIKNAGVAVIVFEQIREAIVASLAESALTIARLGELTAAISALSSTKTKLRAIQATRKAKDEIEKAADDVFGAALATIANGGAAVHLSFKSSIDDANQVASLLGEPISGQNSVADLLRIAHKKLFVAAAALEPFAGSQFSYDSIDAFAAAAAASAADEADVEQFTSVRSKIDQLEAHAQSLVDSKFVPSAANVGGMNVDVASFGAAVPVDVGRAGKAASKAFYVAPLASSPALVNSLARFKGEAGPMMLPADPDADYRYAYVPHSKGHTNAFARILEDPRLLPATNSGVEVGANVFETSPLFMASKARGVYQDQFPEFRFSRAGTNHDDRLNIGVRRTADGKFVPAMDPFALQERMDAINAERLARGERAVDFSADFARNEAAIRKYEADERAVRASTEVSQRFALTGARYGEHYDETAQFNPLLQTDERAAVSTQQAGALRDRGVSAPWNTGAHNVESVAFNKRTADLNEASAASMQLQVFTDEQGNRFRLVDGRMQPLYSNEQVTNAPPPMAETEASAALMHPNRLYRHQQLQTESNSLMRLGLAVLYEMPNTQIGWSDAVDNDWYAPMKFIVWRLFIEFEMYSLIAMKSGITTGGNFIGHQSIEFTNSVMDRMFFGNMIFWHKAIALDPARVRVIENFRPKRYVAGWGKSWVSSADDLLRTKRGSLIATAVEVTSRANEKTRLSFIDNSVPRPSVENTTRGKLVAGEPDYSGARLAGLQYKLDPYRFNSSDFYTTSTNKIGVNAYRGRHYVCSSPGGGYNSTVKGTGHLQGGASVPGAVVVFNKTSHLMFPNVMEATANVVRN